MQNNDDIKPQTIMMAQAFLLVYFYKKTSVSSDGQGLSHGQKNSSGILRSGSLLGWSDGGNDVDNQLKLVCSNQDVDKYSSQKNSTQYAAIRMLKNTLANKVQTGRQQSRC